MMAPLTPEQQKRHDARAKNARRETMRLRRQRAGLALLLVAVAIAGIAFAVRGTLAPKSSAPDPRTGVGASAPTRTVETSASAATSRATEPATATPVPAKAPAPAPLKRLSPAPGVKTIVVDKSEQRVTLYKADGTPVDSFRCASGALYPRVGTYKVWGRAKQSWALTDDTTFFYFTKFATSDKGTSIGFHSIPQEPDGTLVGKLGVPVSHGCVRLDKAKARFVYTWAANGTRVVVRR